MFCEVITSEYVHSGSTDARGGGSTHKANNDADQRKQVCTIFQLLLLHSMVICHFCFNCHFPGLALCTIGYLPVPVPEKNFWSCG